MLQIQRLNPCRRLGSSHLLISFTLLISLPVTGVRTITRLDRLGCKLLSAVFTNPADSNIITHSKVLGRLYLSKKERLRATSILCVRLAAIISPSQPEDHPKTDSRPTLVTTFWPQWAKEGDKGKRKPLIIRGLKIYRAPTARRRRSGHFPIQKITLVENQRFNLPEKQIRNKVF